MPLKKESFEALKAYIPEGSFELVMPLIQHYKVHLVVTRERQTKLGDFRRAHLGKNHRITVNGNLNRFAFLITLLHELAHLLAYEEHGHRIAPHGRQWKDTYGKLLKGFLEKDIFPEDIARELMLSLHNPAASSCAEDALLRVLRGYDPNAHLKVWVEELAVGTLFVIKDGRVFERGEKVRKRIRCYELPYRRVFLFSPLYEITQLLSNNTQNVGS
ncbi:MAG TPA: SprT-like domain-containing protein [Phnomibacter sp.]|nr:SprT-like domain-containing protein [Phnomibacter sp.]